MAFDLQGWLLPVGGVVGAWAIISVAYHNYMIRKEMRLQTAALQELCTLLWRKRK